MCFMKQKLAMQTKKIKHQNTLASNFLECVTQSNKSREAKTNMVNLARKLDIGMTERRTVLRMEEQKLYYREQYSVEEKIVQRKIKIKIFINNRGELDCKQFEKNIKLVQFKYKFIERMIDNSILIRRNKKLNGKIRGSGIQREADVENLDE